MKKLIYTLLLLVLSVSMLSQAQDEAPNIVASHSILGDVVANVVGDVTEINITMPRGADPHSFEVSPGDLIALADADVVFTNGAFYEEGLLEAIENAGMDMRIVEASYCVPIIEVGAHHDEHEDDHNDDDEAHTAEEATDPRCNNYDTLLETYGVALPEYETMGRLHDLSCGEAHEDDHTEGEDVHEEGSCDAHVWMNPVNAMYWTLLIRDTMIDLDPTNAEIYTTNADAYLQTLSNLLNDEIIPLVDSLPAEQRVIITSHDSLGYLAATFDFELVGTIIPGGSTVAEPSVQDIARLIDLIRAENVPAIFAETTISDSVAQTIASETDADLVVLYSGSLSDADGVAPTYVDYIRYNYTTLVEALK